MKEVIEKYIDNISDVNFLVNYINNIKNGRKNNKLVIFYGNGNNGKSKLINEIINEIGINDVVFTNDYSKEFNEKLIILEYSDKLLNNLDIIFGNFIVELNSNSDIFNYISNINSLKLIKFNNVFI